MNNDFSIIVNEIPLYNTIDSILWQLMKHIPNVFTVPIENIVKYTYEIYSQHSQHNRINVHDEELQLIQKRIHQICSYNKTLYELLSQPQVAQRSPEWYELRKNRLTASAVAQAIGKGKFASKADLLKDKAFPELAKPFDSHSSPPLRHGIILEDMSARCYSQRLNNIKIYNFGMIPHPAMNCFGASPDGINELGIMVEIKTPYRRRVDGNIPYEYMVQMQGQMAVCNLHECDFVDAEIYFNYRSMYEYTHDIDLCNNTTDHGIIIEYIDATQSRQYIYSPEYLTTEQCIQWTDETKKEFQVQSIPYILLPWKLVKIMIKRVYFNPEVWNELVPKIEDFWNEVINLRNAGVDALPQKKPKNIKKPTYVPQFIDSDEDEV